MVQGKLRTRSYEVDGKPRTAVEVHASTVEFVRVKTWAGRRAEPPENTEQGQDDVAA